MQQLLRQMGKQPVLLAAVGPDPEGLLEATILHIEPCVGMLTPGTHPLAAAGVGTADRADARVREGTVHSAPVVDPP